MADICPNCQFNNPPGMRFCGNCGTRLPATATPASTEPVTAQNLGALVGSDLKERFQQAGIQAAGQRRNVTVLFADLSDYSHLSTSIDSEDLYDIVQQFIRMLSSAVYRYDGMVDKFTGDGLMALFGAPIAHENNAERAIHAALDMQNGLENLNHELKSQFGIKLSMRVGLNSGVVVVGSIGSNMLMDYTAIGETVNLAQRFETAAKSGEILVSESVYRQTRMLFAFDVRTGLTMKGVPNLVTGYRLSGESAMPGSVRGLEGMSAPMIGRHSELALLEKASQSLLEDQVGAFALIRGEAGIGKSRLVSELKAKVIFQPVKIFQGQSLTYRRSVAYWIFQDLLRQYLGVTVETPEDQVCALLAHRIQACMQSQAADVLPYLEYMLSLDTADPARSERFSQLAADQLRQQIFVAVRNWLIAEAHLSPILIILDDLHWADEASLGLLKFLLDDIIWLPILICSITRPFQGGILAEIETYAKNRFPESYIDIRLKSLQEAQSEQLIFKLLTIPDMPSSLRDQIVKSASGVPFYLEEILRMLIDDNVIYKMNGHWALNPDAEISTLGVPDNLQALILTRFDHLDHEQRRILQVASVIGREFSLAVLSTVLGLENALIQPILDQLVERAFIVPRDNAQESEYAFRHVLTSDAIYSTMLRRDRSKLHGQIGHAIESLYPERLNEFVYLLARHYQWSPQHDKALHYLILAGNKAARDFLNIQAREYYEHALEILPKTAFVPLQACAVHDGLGDVLVFIGEYESARYQYRQAQQYVSVKNKFQAESAVALTRKIGSTFERQGKYDDALDYLAQAIQVIESCNIDLPIESAEVWHDVGWIHFRRGNFDEAGKHLEKALAYVIDSDAYRVIASIYNRLGGVNYFKGDWDQAASHLRNSITIREEIGDMVGLASSSNNLGNLEIEMGLFDDALIDLHRSFDLGKRLGQIEGIAIARNNLGWLYTLRGELDEAEQSLTEALDLSRRIGYSSLLREVRTKIGELYIARQKWDQAIEILTDVAPALEDLGASDQLLHVYRLLAEAALAKGALKQVDHWVFKMDAIAAEYENNKTELPALQKGEIFRFRGMLAIYMQDWSQAEQDLQKSETVFRNLRSRLYLGRTLYQMGRLEAAQNHPDQAGKYFGDAIEIFENIGAGLDACQTGEAAKALRTEN